MDMLYEEAPATKVKAARHILKLALDPQYMEWLGEYDSLLSVLSRVCREEAKKSHELAVAIVGAFYCFSYYQCFHAALAQYDCGLVTLRVLDYENRRAGVRKQELEAKRQEVVQVESPTDEMRRGFQQAERKYEQQLQRQNRLLQMTVGTLINLAEDLQMERKFLQKKLVPLVVPLLGRNDDEVLRVCLTLVKKVSIFEENKNQLIDKGLVDHIVPICSRQDPRTVLLALRTLYNFSFDEPVRHTLAESGILKVLVDLLRLPPFRQYVLKLLYHFTSDDRCKNLMTYYEECMTMLLQLVVEFPQPLVGQELVALVVNLATHPLAAAQMADTFLFVQVVQRVIGTRDANLCKVVRHVVSHDGARERAYARLAEAAEQSNDPRGPGAWIEEFVDMAQKSLDARELLVEVLGTLANLVNPEVQWADLCEGSELIELLHRLLVVGLSEDDIVLECIMLVGTIACDSEAAPLLAASKILQVLQELLAEKQEDDEIVLQLIFTFHCLLMHTETRDMILDETEVVSYLCELLRDKNAAIRAQADETLHLIQAIDLARAQRFGREPQWSERIKHLRFEEHNREWVQEMRREEQGLAPSTGQMHAPHPDDASLSPGPDLLMQRGGGGGGGLDWAEPRADLSDWRNLLLDEAREFV